MRGEDTQGKDAARAATERWIDEWVVGLKLCPWAGASSRAPQMRLLVVDRNFDGGAVETEAQMEAHVAFVEEEAQSLQALGGAHEAGSPETTGEAGPAGASHTTVLVFPGEGYEGDGEGSCGAFPRLARRCEEVRCSRPCWNFPLPRCAKTDALLEPSAQQSGSLEASSKFRVSDRIGRECRQGGITDL